MHGPRECIEVGTESFNADRLILSMQYSTSVYRPDIETALARLACVPPAEAEHLVATAGEDEAAYRPVARPAFLATLYEMADEFLASDDGGFHNMILQVTSYDRSDAVLEFWFHVATPGFEARGVWFRQMAVGIDARHVYAALGEPAPARDLLETGAPLRPDLLR